MQQVMPAGWGGRVGRKGRAEGFVSTRIPINNHQLLKCEQCYFVAEPFTVFPVEFKVLLC
jgi:hypothetical protein